MFADIKHKHLLSGSH